jgi:hypothetical protein
MVTPQEIFKALRQMNPERMWEDNKSPNIVGALNTSLGGTKKNYPLGTCAGPRGRNAICDCVFERQWIEVKCAWMYKDSAGLERNGNFKKHLLSDPNESALVDVTNKLPKLIGHCDVDHVGFLLVCFWSNVFPFDTRALEELIRSGKLSEWNEHAEEPWQPIGTKLTVAPFYWDACAH